MTEQARLDGGTPGGDEIDDDKLLGVDGGDDGDGGADQSLAEESAEEREERARRRGWRPREEWDDARAEREGRRKPTEFLTAEQFLEKTEEEMPVLRQRLRKTEHIAGRLSEQLTEATTKITEMHTLFQEQRKMHLEAKKRAREEGRIEAEKRLRESAVIGDDAGYDAAKKDYDRIIREDAAEPGGDGVTEADGAAQQAAPKIDPAIPKWIKANPWFESDPELNASMIAEHNRVKAQHPNASVAAQLAEAKRRVERRFSERFGGDAEPGIGEGAAARTVNTSQTYRPNGATTAQRWAKLPAEARATYEKFRKNFEASGQKYTKEEYLEEYES